MKYILLFVWILCSLGAMAQSEKGQITGVIKAVDGTPVDAAVISGMNEQGKVLFQCIADGEGKFSALASEGKVRLFVNCLGYVARYTDWLDVTEKTDAGEIFLEAASVELENVVVVGEKQHASIKMDNGNIVFTPKNSALVAGGSALGIQTRPELCRAMGLACHFCARAMIYSPFSVYCLVFGKFTEANLQGLTSPSHTLLL